MANKTKQVVVLNTGGFSKQFFRFMQQGFSSWTIDWLTTEQVNQSPAPDSIVIVADHKFDTFKAELSVALQPKAMNYQSALQQWAVESEYGKAFINLVAKQDGSSQAPVVAMVLSENKGYRKAHYAVLDILVAMKWQPVILCRRELNDAVEQRFPKLVINNNFELASVLHQLPVQLLIADNDIPAETMQRFIFPRLYVPHGVVGLLERFVDMNASQQHMFDLVDNSLVRSFTHLFLPTASVLEAFSTLYESTEVKRCAWMIPGGYLNLDLAIKNTEKDKPRQAILYCPSAIPQQDAYSQRIPVSFPQDSLLILQKLLERFPERTIIFRHHPSAVETPEFKTAIDTINQALINEPKYVYDDNPTHQFAFSQAKLVISDASTSAYTFSLSHCLPTVSFLPNYHEVPLVLNSRCFRSSRQYLGAVVTSTIESLIDEVQKLLDAEDEISNDIAAFRDKEYFNVGQVGENLERTLRAIVEDRSEQSWVKLTSSERILE